MRVCAVSRSRYDAAMPAAEDSLVVYLAPSIAAADSVQFSAKAIVASAEFYTQSVSPLQGVMAAAFLSEGYTPADADSLGLIAGDGLAIRGAAIVADEVTKAIKDSTAQGGPTPRYNRRYYATDHLGTIRAVFDANGNVLEARDYYPFGLQIPDRVFASGSLTREGYTGHELDPETGDYNAGARYYLPELGRWASVDPLAGEFASYSPYNYALNNSVSLLDPNGAEVDTMRVSANDGTHLFTLDDGREEITSVTVRELYRLGVQWFEPLADNYSPLLDVAGNISTLPQLKHFTWNFVAGFANQERSMLSYRRGGGGDWKHSAADGFLMSTIDGYPYWSDAVGQIPFAVAAYKHHNGDTGAVLSTARRFSEGNLVGRNRDEGNGYDIYMVARGINYAQNRYGFRTRSMLFTDVSTPYIKASPNPSMLGRPTSYMQAWRLGLQPR